MTWNAACCVDVRSDPIKLEKNPEPRYTHSIIIAAFSDILCILEI